MVVNLFVILALPQFFRSSELLRDATWPNPSERLHRSHRFAFRHMDLNVKRKSPMFLGRVTKYSLRNRPYEALQRGLARGHVPFIPPNLERVRKNWGWAKFVINKKRVERRKGGFGRPKRDLPFGSVIFPGGFSLV
jgi:hypothetical protein